MSERMTPAMVAVTRRGLGLTLDELADILGVNPRTVRSWESGRDLASAWLSDALGSLVAEHEALVDEYAEAIEDGTPVAVLRESPEGGRPRGWHLIALAMAARRVTDPCDIDADWL